MKNIFLSSAIISFSVLALSSCGNSKKGAGSGDSSAVTTTTEAPVTTAPASTEAPKKENAPETVAYTAAPDTAILGKSREAFVKVVDANAVSLQDADGKSTGSELTIKLSVTNKSKLDNKKFFSLPSSDARLELSNGNAITSTRTDGSSSPEPESTTEATWVFSLPANTKATKLNFFLDGTRVSVGLKEK
jgi:hypothetical protein